MARPWQRGPTTDGPHFGFADDLLQSVLSDLVIKGTITQAQSDAITQGLQDEITQRQADAQARRTLIEGFIADGVITQDEINQLPADDPLRVAFDSIANERPGHARPAARDLGPFGGPGGAGRRVTAARAAFWGGHRDNDRRPDQPGTSPAQREQHQQLVGSRPSTEYSQSRRRVSSPGPSGFSCVQR